jgi:nucleoside-diphosphate-sugar epimerase
MLMSQQLPESRTTPCLLVFGATSVVGGYLLPRLASTSWPVTAVSRQQASAHEQRDARIDWQLGTLPDACPPPEPTVTHIISLGPFDAFVAWLARQSPSGALRQVIAFGSTSTQTKLDSSSVAERDLAQSLLASEAALARECVRLGVRWTLLRPTLIYGGEHDLVARIGAFAARWHVYPRLLGSAGRARRQPVHADDLASAVVAAIDHEATFDQRVDLPGGEELSLAELIARAARTRTRLTMPIPIPFMLGARLATQLRWIGGSSGLNIDAGARISRDQVFNLGPAAQALGFDPRPFEP